MYVDLLDLLMMLRPSLRVGLNKHQKTREIKNAAKIQERRTFSRCIEQLVWISTVVKTKACAQGAETYPTYLHKLKQNL